MYKEFISDAKSFFNSLKEEANEKLDNAAVEVEARLAWVVKRASFEARKHFVPLVYESLFVAFGAIIVALGLAQFLESILPIRGSGTILAGIALVLAGLYFRNKKSGNDEKWMKAK